jgi:hypothetical protein
MSPISMLPAVVAAGRVAAPRPILVGDRALLVDCDITARSIQTSTNAGSTRQRELELTS